MIITDNLVLASWSHRIQARRQTRLTRHINWFGPDNHQKPSSSWSCRKVRRVLRPRSCLLEHCWSCNYFQHVPWIRWHRRLFCCWRQCNRISSSNQWVATQPLFEIKFKCYEFLQTEATRKSRLSSNTWKQQSSLETTTMSLRIQFTQK